MRPNWDDYFLGIALAVSTRADCRRAQYGAVIVTPDRRIVATGYNGSPAGGLSCLAGQCPRGLVGGAHNRADYSDCIALHAEQNAVAHSYGRTVGATIYINGPTPRPPCDMCAKLIAAAGITRTVIPKAGER